MKPSDFFIDIVDFFSILLPGALVTYVVRALFYRNLFGEGRLLPVPQNEMQGWIVFLLVSYVIGHMLFAIGAVILDKYLYDKFLRRLVTKNFDLAYHAATAIRDECLASDLWIGRLVSENYLRADDAKKIYAQKKREVINTFKWGQYYLAVKDPESVVASKRFEASSKFFRSLVVALPIISGILIYRRHFVSAAAVLLLALLCLYRYAELRYKSTQVTYEAVISHEHLRKRPDLPDPVLTQDTRLRFIPSPELIAPYQQRINSLTSGLQNSIEYLSIPANETWEVVNSTASQSFFCLTGKCTLKHRIAAGIEEITVLSPNALVPIPKSSSFQIINNQNESLLLLTVR